MRSLLAVALLIACSANAPAEITDAAQTDLGTTDSPAPDRTAPVCVPGAQVACACVGGGQGVQVCAADGSGLGACACPDAGTVDAPGVDVALPGTDVLTADAGVDALTDRPPATDVNCRNAWEADHDSDGQASIGCGGRDCDDNDPLVGPNAAEFCDGIDQNCDGNADGPLPDGGVDPLPSQWCASAGGGGRSGSSTRCILPGMVPTTCALVSDGGCAACSAERCSCPAVTAPTCVVCSLERGVLVGCTIFTVRNRNPDVRTSCR